MGERSEVVAGPNHALHFVLTLLTFWLCGGWAWVWLVVALQNRRRVVVVGEPAGQYARLGALFVDESGAPRWVNVAAAVGLVAAVVLLLAVIQLL